MRHYAAKNRDRGRQGEGETDRNELFGNEVRFCVYAGAGISSGLKSVGKGVAVGAASLFVLPAVGAAQQESLG